MQTLKSVGTELRHTRVTSSKALHIHFVSVLRTVGMGPRNRSIIRKVNRSGQARCMRSHGQGKQ